MAKFGVEVLTSMTERSLKDIKQGVNWLDLWRDRRKDLLSQNLTPLEVTDRFGLQVEAVEDEKGLHVTVFPLDDVLGGAVLLDDGFGSPVRTLIKQLDTDGTRMEIYAGPSQFIKVELGKNNEGPTSTTLYVFSDSAA